MLSPEEELDVLADDLARAKRDWYLSERAPLEHRVTDPALHRRTLEAKRLRVLELERELALAEADYMEAHGG